MTKMSDDKPVEDLTAEEIGEALITTPQPQIDHLEESAEELRAMGIRDIKDAPQAEAIAEAMKNIQIQKTLSDITRGTEDKRSPKEYLEHHIKFLTSISPGKTESQVAAGMTLEHAQAVLKTTAKMDNVPEAVIKKHLKTLKKKYN